MKSTHQLEEQLREMALKGLIVKRTENNQYLKISYKGSGGLITPKWNIKIYTSDSIVCTDMTIIHDFSEGKLRSPDTSLKLIQIDDAGWGFVLLGVMVGGSDGRRVVTDIIDVSYFKQGPFDRQDYLKAYAEQGWDLIRREFQVAPEVHRIEICTGYINTGLRDLLRGKGFDVRVVEIKGLLQDTLENLFREYVKKTLGADLAYDPKEMSKSQISLNYYKALEFGRKNAPDLLKSGWKVFRE